MNNNSKERVDEPNDNMHYCSEIISISLVENKDNNGAFTALCSIGPLTARYDLCDLGDNINLMPLVVYKVLGMGALKPTSMKLLMTNLSVKKPMGIFCDVQVRWHPLCSQLTL